MNTILNHINNFFSILDKGGNFMYLLAFISFIALMVTKLEKKTTSESGKKHLKKIYFVLRMFSFILIILFLYYGYYKLNIAK